MRFGVVEVGRVPKPSILVQDPTPLDEGAEEAHAAFRFLERLPPRRELAKLIACDPSGTDLGWTLVDLVATRDGAKVGRREILRADMIPEVLKALRNQVGAGVQVVASEWGQSTTVVPAEMSPQGADNAWMNDVRAMHHGAQARSSQGCKGMVLEQLNELPVAIVCPSEDWTVALNATFPQARSIHWADVFVRDLVQEGSKRFRAGR